MKKIFVIFSVCCILVVSAFFMLNGQDLIRSDEIAIENNDACILEALQMYDSIEDFVSNLPMSFSNDNKSEAESYLKLMNIPIDGYTLQDVRYRETVYVAATYIMDDYEEIDGFELYENERNSTAIYEISMFDDAQESLRINYVEKEEYEPIEYNGKTYHYCPEYAANGDLMGHAFGFIADDKLMYVHLPGIYTLDEALELLY